MPDRSKFLGLILLASIVLFPRISHADNTADLTIRTENFVFEFAEADRKAADFLAAHAEQIRSEVTYVIGYDFKAPTRVVVAKDAKSYAAAQDRAIVPEWSVGMAEPGRNIIILLSPRAASRADRKTPLRVFKHEVCHIVLGKALAGREAPRWLDEGIAKHISEPWQNRKTLDMTIAVVSGRVIPLTKLISSWPANEKRARIAYLESQAFVDYLFRQAVIASVVARLREGKNVNEALHQATDRDLPGLETEFNAFLEKNYTWVNFFIGRQVVWGGMSLLTLAAFVATWFKARRKMRRLKLEDELEDLERQGSHLDEAGFNRQRRIIAQLNAEAQGEKQKKFDA